MRTAAHLLLLPLLLLDSAYPARAESDQEEGGERTVITSDGNLLMEHDAQKATFSRNVRVVNPRGTIATDRLVVSFCREGKAVEKIEAFGSVKLDLDGRTGSADFLVYYPWERRTVLAGNAEIRAAADMVRGEEIIFYLDRDEIEVKAATDLKITPPREWSDPAAR